MLGLRTVGDLLHHFPRRYVRTGELTKVTDLRSGEMLTVVGEIVESTVNTYLDRRSRRTAYRLDTTLQTDGPSLRMSFFAKSKHVSEWHAGRLVGRATRHLHRQGQHVPRPVAADQPDHGAVRLCPATDDDATRPTAMPRWRRSRRCSRSTP